MEDENKLTTDSHICLRAFVFANVRKLADTTSFFSHHLLITNNLPDEQYEEKTVRYRYSRLSVLFLSIGRKK